MNRRWILDEAIKAVAGRATSYGEPEDSFAAIASFWTLYLVLSGKLDGIITAEDVAIMMTFLKIARAMNGTGGIDSYIDAAGYMACAGELSKDDEEIPEG